MSTHLLELAEAERVVRRKQLGWERLGLTVEFQTWPPTDKPAAILTLTGRDRMGDLTFWVSGEADLTYGSSLDDLVTRNEEGVTAETIVALMDELASRVAGTGAHIGDKLLGGEKGSRR